MGAECLTPGNKFPTTHPPKIDLSDVEELVKASKVPEGPEPEEPRDNWHSDILSADMILTTDWPEPKWAVPDLIPTGLCILGGAPKVGKSMLALQLTLAVASGGIFLGRKVEPGPTLYFALEDPPRRLQVRMRKQGWTAGLPAQFLALGSFEDRVGDLRSGGAESVARQIKNEGHRLVVIDTLSRALLGDQNDVREMTAWLTPLQEMAHECDCALILIDHHKKSSGYDPNVVADILGSTAKGAIVDTALGLYKERGKTGARLAISGREVAEEILYLRMDWESCNWYLDESEGGLTGQQSELVNALKRLGPCGATKIADAVFGDKNKKGAVYNQFVSLEGKGVVTKIGKTWKVVSHDTHL